MPELTLTARELCLSRLRDALNGDERKAAEAEFEVFSKAQAKTSYLEVSNKR